MGKKRKRKENICAHLKKKKRPMHKDACCNIIYGKKQKEII